jgi:shikimate dehydrogenase
MSRHLAVLGSPIAHSKSPAIHAAAYRTLQLNWDYTKVEVEQGRLMQFIEALDSDWLGLSITMPLKEEALRIANEQTSLAEKTGVANTLLRTTLGWKAHNTDVFGIEQSIARALNEAPHRVLVIGSGATAVSAVFAVASAFPNARITVAARNSTAAEALRKRAKNNDVKIKLTSLSTLKSLINRSDLVISTLPAKSLDDLARKLSRSLFAKPRGTLLDVAYEPWPSTLASFFFKNKCEVISGVEMLIWQAIAQMRLFNHNDPDVELPNERAVELAMRHSLGLI